MTIFLQACGGVLIAVILILTLGSHGKEMGSLLGLFVCCMVILLALRYLQPVLDLIRQLQGIGDLDYSMIGILLKVVGIGLISEIAALICADAGNAALGKTLQLLSASVILWLSIPLFEELTALLQRILGEA